MEEIEMQSTEGVSTESSPSTPESAASNQSATPANGGGEAKSNNDSANNTPFHEHPRWKEVMSERDQFKSAMQEMQKRLSDYENRFKESQPKPESSEQKMLSRLKTVDPEFAAFMESIYTKLPKVDQLEQQYQASQAEAQRNAVQSQLNSLHEQYKVPAEQRELYRSILKSNISDDPNARIEDLPKYYKSVHDTMSKLLDTTRRSERESYVAGKKADASIPAAQNRSATPKPAAKKEEYSKNPDEAKRQVINRAVQAIRAQKESA